jgi:diguanylate cyclase (GGDEF)-like protein
MSHLSKIKEFISNPRFSYIILFLVTLAVGLLFIMHAKQSQDEEMRDNLIIYAKTIEKSIDWQPFAATLNSDPNQIKPKDLAGLNAKLNNACRVNSDCHFIYLLYLDNSQNKNLVRFLLDASPQPPSEISKITEVFSEASAVLKKVMQERKPLVEGPVTDHWGTWVSARIPVGITANTQNFVMLNIDVDAAGWSKRLLAKTFLPALLTLFFLTIFTGLILRNQYIENLLKQLFTTNSELSELAYYDSLTGLPNRRLLDDRASLAFKAAKRAKQMVAIMFLDLDYFKAVNDDYGHDIGDHLLVNVATRLKVLLRSEDTLARIGGDEFVILLPKIEDEQQATVAAEKIIKELTKPFVIDDKELQIGGSLGVAIYTKHGATPNSLLKCADEAMYSAKRLGRNMFVIYADDIFVSNEDT